MAALSTEPCCRENTRSIYNRGIGDRLVGLIKALENSVTFSMPVTITPLYIIFGFVVVMLSYELSKLLCRRKVNAVSMSEALKSGTE
ncbi:hypothetical protein [Clostridium sp. BJN0013]|uniref:hypothetical protein n=1 Tax=Clostridium sp. BJN0013 TaxID=3236840 RepID=UPI0034C6877B